MRICMVCHDMQGFGGLEEYAVTLAIDLRRLGHETSVLSDAWVAPDNQYKRRLRDHRVPFAEMPKWLSRPASDWETKLRVLGVLMRLCSPLVYLAGVLHFLVKRGSWKQSLGSARNWLRGTLLDGAIGPDRRQPLTRLLLRWWGVYWRPDVLHIHGYTSTLLFVVEWAHAHGVPVVYVEHQTPDAQFDWWADFGRTINKATTVVAVSEASAEALRKVCGVVRPIAVVGPVVPDPCSGRQPQLASRGAASGVNVTTVARLYVTKGLTHLLDAIVSVRAVHPLTRFTVYGEGPLRAELVAYADRLGLDSAAIFPGAFTSRDALGKIMAETDVFVMSSVLEGQPMGLVEAMAYGCPIVATAVGGIPELIEDGVNGLLCEPRDSDCLASKLITLIEDPDLRLRLGRAARQSYEAGPFQPDAASARMALVYQETLERARRAPEA